jgi:FMN-dependent NADH-azoreductase
VTILHIDASINGANSASRAISRSIVDQLTIEHGGADVVYRDLAAEPLPHLTLEAFADTSVLDEFLAADTIVIGAPMHNFNIPTTLKAHIDQIGRAGRTFRYDANGPEGLAKGKKLFVITARGGLYGPGSPAETMNHQTPYLKAFFGFIGITDVTFIDAEAQGIAQHAPVQYEAALSQIQQHAA